MYSSDPFNNFISNELEYFLIFHLFIGHLPIINLLVIEFIFYWKSLDLP
jgi:hypothetical protein